MKTIQLFLFIASVTILFSTCKTTENHTETIAIKDNTLIESESIIQISFITGKHFNHPTFVIWKEDMNGNLKRTLFVTKAYASGIFGHEMRGDTMWLNKSGASVQPAALPYWTYKKGEINGNLIPTSQNPYTDATTGATPERNFLYTANNEKGNYRILLEVNQTWDWNKFWTNNKYPENFAYKHSAQPSIIYAVTINQTDSVFFMNPIGHGNPKGENGKLYTDISTLTTATEIFESIKIEILNQ